MFNAIKIMLCDLVVAAFDTMAGCVGTRVIAPQLFLAALADAIKAHDTSQDRTPGQHFIVCPTSMFELVGGGVGPASSDPSSYLLREWRGEVQAFLRREFAEPVTWLACVVYTKAAYLADPECAPSDPVHTTDCTHVLVAVLAGSSSPLQPGRFVWNLAGNNNEALLWSADEIRTKAKEVMEYWSKHSVVADPDGC